MSVYCCRPPAAPLNATLTLPGSKSITNRALVAAALADGASVLENALFADDTRRMIDAIRALGVAVTTDEPGASLEITGCGGHLSEIEAEIFCGNSGTTMRFCTALAALGHGQYSLDGVPRMRERPIGELVTAIRQLGARVECVGQEGFPPIVVHAHGLRGGHLSIHSPASSQFISALLLAAPYASGDVLLEVTGKIPSAPYLATTTKVMERFGIDVLDAAEPGSSRFVIEAPRRYTAANLTIEPDASNAAYFLAAPALVGGRVTVEGLGESSVQGDIHFVKVLEMLGCRIDLQPTRTTVMGPERPSSLCAVDVDLSDMPDTAQTLAVLALFADSTTTIRGLQSLRLKETDRVAAIAAELHKLGAKVEASGDVIHISPGTLRPARIETYDDHRMVMSFALAGLRIPGLEILSPECCAKTMPDFFEYWETMLGAAG